MKFADSFRAARWVRLVNLLLQAVLFLTLFAGLNYIAQNHSWRFDLTARRQHSLSPETLSYLERLEHDVHVYVTFRDDGASPDVAQARRDLDKLLREYTYATRGKPEGAGRVHVQFLDVYRDPVEAESRGLESPNVVVVVCQDRRRTVAPSELYRVADRRRSAFQGETALTAAILDVSSPDKKKIYLVRGHGEISPDDLSPSGLSLLREELRVRNYDIAHLDLAAARKVPDDAALVIIAGPTNRFQPYEEETLRNYLASRAGRLIILIGPGPSRHGLENLFFDWGVMVYDNLILESDPEAITETNEILLRNFHPRDPLVQNLITNRFAIHIGPARVVNEDLGRTEEEGLDVKTLVATGKTAWGERDYSNRNVLPTYTAGEDLKGNLGVVTISERTKPAPQIHFSVRGGRLAVIGAADLVANNRIFTGGNLNLFLALVDWTVERDTQLTIPARPIQHFQLSLSQEELLQLRLGLLLLVPGAVAVVGLIVYWTRRN
ncbi:MAG TPA: GldG family protein [Opitutaceae bacterium]|nr:GldG family protein [Opitutaceae bacterium]